MNRNSSKILILCSPSAGILDSWLPVVKRIHEEYPEITFSIIFPRNRTVSEIDLDSTLLQFYEEIVDSVIFRGSKSSKWYRYDSLKQAKEHVASSWLERSLDKTLSKNRYGKYLMRYARRLFRDLDLYLYKD